MIKKQKNKNLVIGLILLFTFFNLIINMIIVSIVEPNEPIIINTNYDLNLSSEYSNNLCQLANYDWGIYETLTCDNVNTPIKCFKTQEDGSLKTQCIPARYTLIR